MIADAVIGSGFKGLSSYLARGKRGKEPERVEWVEARNLPTTDLDLAPKLMRHTANLSKRCKKPVYHLSISWPEKEQLGREAMLEITDQVLDEIGLKEHQAIILAHNDTKHPHVHVMANRIHPESGKAWKNNWDYARIEKSLRGIERERGLERVQGRHTDQRYRDMQRRPTKGEHDRAKRLGEPARTEWTLGQKRALRRQIGHHFREAGSWEDLALRLDIEDYFLLPKGQGLVISDGRNYAKLSDMGKGIRLRGKDGIEARFQQTWSDFERTWQLEPEPEREGFKRLPPAQRRRRRSLEERERQRERDRLRDRKPSWDSDNDQDED